MLLLGLLAGGGSAAGAATVGRLNTASGAQEFPQPNTMHIKLPVKLP